MNKKLHEMMLSYRDSGISVIPVKMVMDEKTQIAEGKFPAIRNWQEYCDRLPTEGELIQWASIKGISGIAIVLGRASNLCCIDIDTENKSLQKKILEVIPHSPILVKGNPLRHGKLLYRIYDTENEYVKPSVGKEKVKDGKVTVADILYENAYVVIPPSIHSQDETGHRTMYKWDKFDLDKVGMVNVPILEDRNVKEKIDMVVRGMTKSDIAKNLPKGAIDLSDAKSPEMDGHRHEDMVSYCASLIAKKLDPTTAISDLLHRDMARNSSDPYFLDKTKGHKTQSRELNATMFYLGNLSQKNRSKHPDEYEIPKLSNEKIYKPSADWSGVKKNSVNVSRSLPPFNYDWIPNKAMKKFVKEASEATCIAPQSLFMYMLGGYSTLIGNKLKVNPYMKNNNYVETGNLYMGIVASSGERKTETVSMALKPLKHVNKMAKKQVQEENARAIKDAKYFDIKLRKLNKELADAVEESDDPTDDFIMEIEKKITELEEKKPKTREISLIERIATVEKLYEVAEANPTGCFLEFNEIGAKWRELHLKGKEKDKQFIMDAWDGRSTFSYSTKHNGDVMVDELCMSSGFCGQYDVMEDIVYQLLNEKGANDGLLQRFMIFCSDLTEFDVRDVDFKYPQEIFTLYEETYYIEKNDTPIKLTNEAHNVWMEYQKEIGHKKELEKLGAIESSLGKYVGLSVRVALNLEVISNEGRRPKEITSESMTRAIEICRYAEAHLRYLFGLGEKRKIDEIISALKTGIIEDEISVRDLYRSHQGMFGRNAVEAMEVLEKLAKMNVIAIVKDGKSNLVKINPEIKGG